MDHTDNSGGVVPTTLSLVYKDEVYPVYNITEGVYYVDILKETYRVLKYDWLTYTSANGTDIWNPEYIGRVADFGYYEENLAFHKVEAVVFEPDYYGDFILFTLQNGTVLNSTEVKVFTLFEYEIYGTSFYSVRPYTDYFYNDTDGSYFYYIEAINGSRIILPDWRTPNIVSTSIEYAFRNVTTSYWVFNFSSIIYDFEGYNYRWAYRILNSIYSGDLYLNQDSSRYAYNVTYLGSEYTAIPVLENLLTLRNQWGYELMYGLTPIQSVTYRNIYELIIGTPRWGMWDVRNWVVNPDNGALDLDGDLESVEDQYYVLEVYTSSENWNRTWDMMWVDLSWDPNVTLYGDEMNVDSWMGLNTFTWSYDWARRYYWIHPETNERLTSEELGVVNSTIVNEDGFPRPGYWDLSWMIKNVTYADYLAEAEENGWDWVDTNEQTWTWISFGMNEEYGIDYRDPPFVHYARINMRYEFSGLFIWEDEYNIGEMDVNPQDPGTGELTHYFLPDSVASITFVTPGTAYGDPSTSGEMRVELDDEVTWGVTFTDINGTAYPYNAYGYWGWYERMLYGSDMRTFDERPTEVTIDEISFLVHFEGNLNTTEGAINNYVNIKVDNYIGNWDVDMLGGRENLENRSLALNYLAEVDVDDYSFKTAGVPVDPHSTVSAAEFQFETANTRFAEMIMGGTTYEWSKNTSASYDVLSHTTPISTFTTAYESKKGKNAMGWNFTESMFYITIGFPEWDGFSVFQDPVFVGYTSVGGTIPVIFGTLAIDSGLPIAGESVTIGVDFTSSVDLDSVDLMYSTDQTTWESVEMTNTVSNHWTGQIPSHTDGTLVYYKVVVHSSSYSDYESDTNSYTVGAGEEPTDTPTTGTTTTGPPIGDWPPEVILMLVGFAGVACIVLLVLVSKRRKY